MTKMTPDYYHVLDDRELRMNVYEPEADSFLLLDAIDELFRRKSDQHRREKAKKSVGCCAEQQDAREGSAVKAFQHKEVIQFDNRSNEVADASSLSGQQQCSAMCQAPLFVAEIGVGSGIALCHAAVASLLLQRHQEVCQSTQTDDAEALSSDASSALTSVCCFGIDVNPLALKATKETFRRTFADPKLHKALYKTPSSSLSPLISLQSRVEQAFYLNLVRGDLLHWMRSSSAHPGHIDLLLFNPPYVPTSEEELAVALRGGETGKDWLPSAWAGGLKGRAVLDRCLPLLPDIMAKKSDVLLVALDSNDPEEIIDRVTQLSRMKGRNVSGNIIIRRWTGEKLCVIHFEFCENYFCVAVHRSRGYFFEKKSVVFSRSQGK